MPARLVLDPDRHTVVSGRARPVAEAASARAAQVQSVPLPSGAVQVDSTWYDLQDMGSLANRIEVGSDGRVHVTWQDDFCELGGGCPPPLSEVNPAINRAMGYAVRGATGAWTHLGKVQDLTVPFCGISERIGGFGDLAVMADGRAAIAQHMNEDGEALRGLVHLQRTSGGTVWDGQYSWYAEPSPLFPQVAVRGGGGLTMTSELPRIIVYDETEKIRVASLTTPTSNYTCGAYPFTNWADLVPSTLWRDGRGAFPSMASSANGRVGVAITDFAGNVFLVESSDGSFTPATRTIRNLTQYSDASITAPDSTSTQYRPFIHCHLAYRDTTPHVVWSEVQARRISGNLAYFDHRSRIRMWSSVRGLETVYQNPAGVADRYDDIDLGLSGPIAGFNTISLDWPQVGFSADGSETYVAWLRFTDAQVDPTANAGLPGIVTGIGFGDIAATVTRDGEGWSVPENLTQTPLTDERFFSLAARNPGGRLHLLFQASATDQAGVALIGDRGTNPGPILRRVAYLEKQLAASVLDVPPAPESPRRSVVRVSPNPASSRGVLRFEAEASSGHRSLEIVDLLGRRVAVIDWPARAAERSWPVATAADASLSAGIYFARFAGDPARTAVRFVLAR